MSVETKKIENPEGIYRHQVTGVEIELKYVNGMGNSIIDAFVQNGFVYIGNKKAEVVSEPKEEKPQEEIEKPKK